MNYKTAYAARGDIIESSVLEEEELAPNRYDIGKPKYDFTYYGLGPLAGFRDKLVTPELSPIETPIPERTKATALTTVGSTPSKTSGSQMSSQDSDNGSSLASTNMSINRAKANINEADSGAMYGPDGRGLIPGYGFLDGFFRDKEIADGYGAPGTYSSITGGQFNEDGRSIDPITGYANPEFSNQNAFKNYMLGDLANNIAGDVDNAYDYKRGVTDPVLETQFARSKGLPIDDDFYRKTLLDKGIAESSLRGSSDPNSIDYNPTLGAMDINNYIDGVAPMGSQFSKTGTFSTGVPEVDPFAISPDDYPKASNQGFRTGSTFQGREDARIAEEARLQAIEDERIAAEEEKARVDAENLRIENKRIEDARLEAEKQARIKAEKEENDRIEAERAALQKIADDEAALQAIIDAKAKADAAAKAKADAEARAREKARQDAINSYRPPPVVHNVYYSNDANSSDNNSGNDGTDGGYGGSDNSTDHGGTYDGALIMANGTGGLSKRPRDNRGHMNYSQGFDRNIPNPILQDPLATLFRR